MTFTALRSGGAKLYAKMGPSWLAGAIAAGPATMASLLTAGTSFGFALLWVVVLSAILGTFAQYLAMRLGLRTETGLVAAVERHLGGGWAWLLVADAVLAAGLAQLVIMKGVADISATITGIDARIWGVAWALVLAFGLAGGGYRVAELGAKLLVSAVVCAFIASLFVVPIDPSAAIAGLVPMMPAGLSGALVVAGILGGAVHITLITMHSYTMRARGWTRDDTDIATTDIVASMFVAFGIYSLAIFLVAASVLHGAVSPEGLTHVSASQALGPLVGANAKWLFLLGLWGAAVSTLGGNTVVPPFLLADKLGWGTTVEDSRYRLLLAGFALVSAVGPFVGGSFFPLLVLVLAFGLVGTPFAIAIVLALLNDRRVVGETPAPWTNLGGVVLICITVLTAGSFVRGHLSTPGEPLSAFVLVFAAVLGTATLVVLGLAVRTALREETPRAATQ
ncbi:NRAMP family divalent metal transporter [Haladaptatus sp. YSMS36]|uniref:NRAMP family divalent metal transporter n=1 Tax=Haladaptatus sp. YSMS36 TaxID=3033384 RepID=UPI0023E86D05|nr:divalent metal cation transporter [Haladaptatus sp. YSMS36]